MSSMPLSSCVDAAHAGTPAPAPDFRIQGILSPQALAGSFQDGGPDAGCQRLARSLARSNPGLPWGFAEAFATQAVCIRDMSETQLRQRIAGAIVSAWDRAVIEGAVPPEVFALNMGLQGQPGWQAVSTGSAADVRARSIAAGLRLEGTPAAGMPSAVRDRYDRVLRAGGRIEPDWGLLQAWLSPGPA